MLTLTTLSPRRRVLPAGAQCSNQGEAGSSDGVSAAHHPPTLVRGRGRGASSCWRRGPRGVRRGTVGGQGPLLAGIDSEDFMIRYWNWDKYIAVR